MKNKDGESRDGTQSIRLWLTIPLLAPSGSVASTDPTSPPIGRFSGAWGRGWGSDVAHTCANNICV